MDINATIIGQTIAMIVFVWFCMKFVWPLIIEMIEERQTKIAEGLAAAEKGSRALEEAEVEDRTPGRAAALHEQSEHPQTEDHEPEAHPRVHTRDLTAHTREPGVTALVELEGEDELAYDDRQYETLTRLLAALLRAYPELSARRIAAHSDIAPGRKTDPGPAFDWLRLYDGLSRELSEEESDS